MPLPDIGIRNAAKLGIVLGIGWVLIFAGCLANIREVGTALRVAAMIFIVVVLVLFSAPFWVPGFIQVGTIDKIGGGDGIRKCPVCGGPLEPDTDYPEDLLCGKCEKVFDAQTLEFVENFDGSE